MRAQAPKLLPLLCFCLPALAGCGGGDSSTSSASPAPGIQTSTVTTEQPKPKSSNRPTEAPKPKPPTGPAPTDPDPLPNQGTSAVAPGVPTSKGGDNSIQTYGTEADSSERVEASAALKAYLKAQAQERWDEACSYVNAKVIEGFGELGKRPRPGGCAVAMGTLFGEAPKAKLSQAADIEVISMRTEGEQAFLVYRDGDGKAFDMPMTHEGDRWLVGSLIGIELVL